LSFAACLQEAFHLLRVKNPGLAAFGVGAERATFLNRDRLVIEQIIVLVMNASVVHNGTMALRAQISTNRNYTCARDEQERERFRQAHSTAALCVD
jgi:hypothetical protein